VHFVGYFPHNLEQFDITTRNRSNTKTDIFQKVILYQQNAKDITGSDVAYRRNLISSYRKALKKEGITITYRF
jgi:hypothetical protein